MWIKKKIHCGSLIHYDRGCGGGGGVGGSWGDVINKETIQTNRSSVYTHV